MLSHVESEIHKHLAARCSSSPWLCPRCAQRASGFYGAFCPGAVALHWAVHSSKQGLAAGTIDSSEGMSGALERTSGPNRALAYRPDARYVEPARCGGAREGNVVSYRVRFSSFGPFSAGSGVSPEVDKKMPAQIRRAYGLEGARRLGLGQTIVLVDAYGNTAAEEELNFYRCPHRSTPLSLGRVSNGRLECPYHGWQFGAHGLCEKIPTLRGDEPIPQAAAATAHPVAETQKMIWV